MRETLSATSGHPLHLGIVTETYPPEINGVAMTLGRLADVLREHGHRVSVLCPRRSERHGADPDLCEVPGLPLPGYRDLRFGLPAAGMIRRLWREQAPDVLYVATQGPLGASAIRVARRLEIPVVSGFHTNFHTYCRHYHVAWMEQVVFAYLRRFHNRTATTLVPTAALRANLAARGVRNVEVLGRGIDTALFTPARRDVGLRVAWGVTDDAPAVLYVGRLAAEKNLQLAVRAFRALQGARPEARFVLVGDGPLAARLREEHPDFVFCGMRTGTDLAAHYASGDLFLFPSLTETFGNVLLEALASGLAVVAYDYAAANQHIRASDNGLTAPCGDEEAFIRHALTLASDPALRQTLRVRARLQALSQGWPQIGAQFETLLRRQLRADRAHTLGYNCNSGG
ncbi:MAG: glycosyltransferase family 1 protein [Gammaproteobacteria bacterium]|nr:glycosyltransferase family 1 protein [Gammaproteobacteria bacterium]